MSSMLKGNKKIKIETENFELNVEIDEENIPDYEIERRNKFKELRDLKILYKFIDKNIKDESLFEFRIKDFNDNFFIIKGSKVENILVNTELFCYIFILKSGYIHLVTNFDTVLNVKNVK